MGEGWLLGGVGGFGLSGLPQNRSRSPQSACGSRQRVRVDVANNLAMVGSNFLPPPSCPSPSRSPSVSLPRFVCETPLLGQAFHVYQHQWRHKSKQGSVLLPHRHSGRAASAATAAMQLCLCSFPSLPVSVSASVPATISASVPALSLPLPQPHSTSSIYILPSLFMSLILREASY